MVTRGYTVRGFTQCTAAGPATFGYDANGDLTSDGGNVHTYEVLTITCRDRYRRIAAGCGIAHSRERCARPRMRRWA